MRRVIDRGETSIVDGCIVHDDRPTTYEAAEALAGKRLDRRKNYAIVGGMVCESSSWTQECTGCDAGGCEECGYQGRTRQGMWIPINPEDWQRMVGTP